MLLALKVGNGPLILNVRLLGGRRLVQLVKGQQVASREACCFLVIALTPIVHDGHDLRLGEGACRPHHGNQLWKYSVDVAPVFLGEGLVTAVWLQKRS